MIVVENLVGDESDEYLSVEYIDKNLRSSIYKLLVANEGKGNKDILKLIDKEVKGILKNINTAVKDPQTQCTLKEGVVSITFLVPSWLAQEIQS